VFFLGVAVAGAVVAAGAPLWLLLIVALTGTLSTDVVDNGPATTLEQVMLAGEDARTARAYGRYNAVGAAAGALGALAAAAPGLGRVGTGGAVNVWLFLALVPFGLTGALFASQLSPAVEAPPADPDLDRSEASTAPTPTGRLGESRSVVRRLAALFAMDVAGGGLVTTGFLSYYFAQRYGVTVASLGWLFFTVSLVQAGSVMLAPRLARRFGLVATMVGTHLPSNILLASIAFAPSFPVAAALLVARTIPVADGRSDPPGARDERGDPGRADRSRSRDQRRAIHGPPSRTPCRLRGPAGRSRRAAADRGGGQGRVRRRAVALGPPPSAIAT